MVLSSKHFMRCVYKRCSISFILQGSTPLEMAVALAMASKSQFSPLLASEYVLLLQKQITDDG